MEQGKDERRSWEACRAWDGGGEQPGVPFIGAGRRWSAVEAGRRARRPLMVLGLVGASRNGGAVRGGGADDGTARADDGTARASL